MPLQRIVKGVGSTAMYGGQPPKEKGRRVYCVVKQKARSWFDRTVPSMNSEQAQSLPKAHHQRTGTRSP